MKAVVMAGGEGSRLRPLTLGRPKPMIPLVNKPMLEHILMLLKRNDIVDVVITLQYMPERIRDYYGNGASLGMNIRYTVETVPLGTAGSVKLAMQHLDDEPFVVIAGDALTDLDLRRVVDTHHEKGALATIALARVADPGEFGVVQSAPDGRIVRFFEKPSWSEVMSDTVNTGIYVLEPDVMARVEADHQYDFAHDLFPAMVEQGEAIYGCETDGYWTDVGQLGEYLQATADILHRRVHVGDLGYPIGGDIFVEGEYEIAPDARLYGPIYLGEGVKIKGGVVIEGPTVLGDNVVVDTGARISHSIVWRNCYIGEGAELRGAILGSQCTLKARVLINDGAVVSDNTIVRDGAIIQSEVLIWPDKEIEANATMTTNLIWGATGRRRLFGPHGITGMVNVELTPEFCARVGEAYGSILPKGATVMLNREDHNTPRVLKRALLSGLPVVGINVCDLATQPVPVARYYVSQSNALGGVHVRLSPYDNKVVDIKFFDERGLDLDSHAQRSIERLFYREDYRRAYLDEMGSIDYATDVQTRYNTAVQNALHPDMWPLGEPYDRLVIDYANASAASVLPSLLVALRCDAVVVNALVDQSRLFRSRKEWEQDMARLAQITRALECNFGARLDVGGARVFFTSDEGTMIDDWQALIAVATLLCQVKDQARIGVALNAPQTLERAVAPYGGHVRRLSLGDGALMEAASTGEFDLLGDGSGGYIFPHFTPFIDGIFALLQVIELTRRAGRTLSDVWREREPFVMRSEMVPVPSAHRGRMIRRLHEELNSDVHSNPGRGLLVREGEQQVLIWPSADESGFDLYVEGKDQEAVEVLLERSRSRLLEILEESAGAGGRDAD